MSERKVRLHDVAEKAGVSVTTVSHALRGTRFVSGDTRRQIDSVMQNLGVTVADFPHRSKGEANKFSGFLIDNLDEPFFRFLGKGVLDTLGAVQINFTDSDPSKSDLALKYMIESRIPGVILVPRKAFPFASQIRFQLEASGIHTVFVDKDELFIPDDFPHAGEVYANNEPASKEAVRRLARLGYRRIALMTEHTHSTLFLGYRKGLEEASLPLIRELLVEGSGIEAGKAITHRLLEMEKPPTAIIAGSYNMTLGVLGALNDVGLHYPEDIAVVGSDYPYPYGEYQRDYMMIINRPGELIGRTAAELLIRSIEGNKIEEREIAIPSDLVVQTFGPSS